MTAAAALLRQAGLIEAHAQPGPSCADGCCTFYTMELPVGPSSTTGTLPYGMTIKGTADTERAKRAAIHTARRLHAQTVIHFLPRN